MIYMLEIVGLLALPITVPIAVTNTFIYLTEKKQLINRSIKVGKDTVLKELYEEKEYYSSFLEKILSSYGKDLAKERFISGKYDKIINSYERS
ncbi:MAG: hypothetical protein J7J92_00930 [Candidatus Aenigmarchaeota archaeon]|nr:hypothetical protein [Candidatus Aenigmarchaeota archaeon]